MISTIKNTELTHPPVLLLEIVLEKTINRVLKGSEIKDEDNSFTKNAILHQLEKIIHLLKRQKTCTEVKR